MPRAIKASGNTRHDPLLVQLDEDQQKAKYGRVSEPGKRKKTPKKSVQDNEDSEVTLSYLSSHVSSLIIIYKAVLDPKTSRRILELAKIQQEELDASETEDEEGEASHEFSARGVDEEEEVDGISGEDVEEIFVRLSYPDFHLYTLHLAGNRFRRYGDPRRITAS